MVRNAPLSQNNYWRKQRLRKQEQFTIASRNMRLSVALYLNTGQLLHLTVAAYCALKRRRIKRELRMLQHPDSFRRIFPHYKRLDFSSFPCEVYRDKFRLPKPLCVKIKHYLIRNRGFGEIVRVPLGYNRNKFYTFPLEELILIYLRRLSLPDRNVDVAVEFGRNPSETTAACMFMCEHINVIAKEFLDGRPCRWWDEETARYNAELVNAFNVPLKNVCIFIDGSLQCICNPWVAAIQVLYYTGYIKHTANKIIMGVCPQGLFVIVTGWAQGRRHDMAVAVKFNLYPKLLQKTQFQQFQGKVFGDSAFRRQDPVYTPFNPSNTARKREFNKRMASVRISAEWAFKIVRGLFPSTKYIPRQKIM